MNIVKISTLSLAFGDISNRYTVFRTGMSGQFEGIKK